MTGCWVYYSIVISALINTNETKIIQLLQIYVLHYFKLQSIILINNYCISCKRGFYLLLLIYVFFAQ